jgi:hypothetical protein
MVFIHKEDMHEAQGKNGNICLNRKRIIHFQQDGARGHTANDSLLDSVYVAENKQGIVAFSFARSDPKRLLLMGYGYDV